MAAFEDLKYVDAKEKERLKPLFFDILSTYHARSYMSILNTSLKSKVRLKLAALTIILILFAVSVRSFLPPFSLGNGGSGGIVAAILILEFLLIVKSRLRYQRTLLFQLTATGGIIYATWRMHVFKPSTKSTWDAAMIRPPSLISDLLPSITLKPIHITAYSDTYAALWILSAAGFGGLIYLVVRFNIFMLTHEYSDPSTFRAEYCTSEIIVTMLDLAISLQNSLNRKLDRKDSFIHDRRGYLGGKLAELSRTISGPWPRLIRRSYGSAGYEIASHADGVAFTFRKWQLQSAFIGNHLNDVSKSLQSSLVNAIEGKWQLLVPENSPELNLNPGRIARAIRRLTAILLPLAVALASWVYLGGDLAQFKQPVIVACLAFSALQVLIAIDPQAPERIDAVQKITDIFKRN
ncbi:hypothetical protein [Streptosporangium sandarakinum]|uniref:hypothetical protein n=1 Tax=Streptosporangium sandarakinum TaxID=1260955 RepID=UPI0034306603